MTEIEEDSFYAKITKSIVFRITIPDAVIKVKGYKAGDWAMVKIKRIEPKKEEEHTELN